MFDVHIAMSIPRQQRGFTERTTTIVLDTVVTIPGRGEEIEGTQSLAMHSERWI